MSTIERDELEAIIVDPKLPRMVKYDDARRIVDDLKAKLSEVTRERDELDAGNKSLSRLNVNAVAYAEKVEKKLSQAREQLEQVTRERDEAREESERALQIHRAVQAEAAAMRRVIEMITVHRRVSLYGAADAWRDNAEKALSGTAGRAVLDEMRKLKLEAYTATQSYHAMRDRIMPQLERQTRKCRTAKAALVESYRGKIDPAWFGDQPTPEPVWQYRASFGRNYIWRTCDGQHVEQRHIAEREFDNYAERYTTWQACVDDPATYPCTESGERIEDHSADAGKMVSAPSAESASSLDYEKCWIHNATREQLIEVLKNNERYQERADARCIAEHDRLISERNELREQLAAQAPLVAIARELRSLLKSDYTDDEELFMAEALKRLLIKLRDAGGGVA